MKQVRRCQGRVYRDSPKEGTTSEKNEREALSLHKPKDMYRLYRDHEEGRRKGGVARREMLEVAEKGRGEQMQGDKELERYYHPFCLSLQQCGEGPELAAGGF